MTITLETSSSSFDHHPQIEAEIPRGQMDKLFIWIHEVRVKKMKWLRSKRRNIRVEAVLAHALLQAEHELRRTQIVRIQRWQQMQERMLADKVKQNGDLLGDNDSIKSDVPSCPALVSLNSFMENLSKIKTPPQR